MIKMPNRKVIIRSVSLTMSAVVLVGAGLLAGCTTIAGSDTGSSKAGGNNPSVVQENKVDKLASEFLALAGENPKPDAIIEFMDKNIAGVSKDSASKMLEELEKAQKNCLSELEEKYYIDEAVQSSLSKIYNSEFDLDKIDDIKDAKLKNLLKETRDMGYKVETAEGMYFPIINYEYIKKYSSYAEDDMKDYIDVMAVESNKMSAKDGALMLSWDEIIERALVQEGFIKKYGSSDKVESIKELEKRYLTFMLFGLNNTPLFSYDTKAMEPEAKEAYAKAVKDNGNSELMQMLGKYMDILGKSDYKLSDEVDKFRKDAIGGTIF